MDTIPKSEAWELLGRIRVALMEAGVPEHAMAEDVETLEDEVREIEKGIRLLAEGR
jgi:hypothetical protein